MDQVHGAGDVSSGTTHAIPTEIGEMTAVFVVGVAVIDFVLFVDAMPRKAEKYRAREAAIVGGGCAANAAVAVSRLGGTAMLAARLGDDRIADMIVTDLEADGVDCRLVRRFPGRASSFSSIFVDAAGERQIVNFRDRDLDRSSKWLYDNFPKKASAALTRLPPSMYR